MSPYETFDIDLRDGKARENAFVHVLLQSRVEHKRDKLAAKTGNIAVELEQVCSDGVKRPSGVMSTTAEYFAFEYYPEFWFIVPTKFVKNLARRAVEVGKAAWIGNDNNHYNALVPIEWFVRPNDSGGAT